MSHSAPASIYGANYELLTFDVNITVTAADPIYSGSMPGARGAFMISEAFCYAYSNPGGTAISYSLGQTATAVTIASSEQAPLTGQFKRNTSLVNAINNTYNGVILPWQTLYIKYNLISGTYVCRFKHYLYGHYFQVT